MNKTKLKQGDAVIVIAGSHKGKQGPISRFNNDKSRVYIKGIKGLKHKKPSQNGEEGGIIEIEVSVAISNVAIVDPKNKNKFSKIGYKEVNKNKVRIAKKSGTVIK
ncbi:50S ribosomal protein L24 [Spiroplasma endosymbiont of Crioceris asparagi]|uniref:50S ribosomal protein L24 n=1 Tax=Spiroplasma endosymbiont of Crioceris asparagi TaxID=3066286 RepID=UPI0030CA5DCD